MGLAESPAESLGELVLCSILQACWLSRSFGEAKQIER
jgi:hypothetical protein